MATRFNFKFIAIVFMATVTAVGIIGALWVIQTRSDAAHHVERGELAYAEGEYARAAQSYSRAVRRDPANKDYLRRLEEIILKIRPDTLDEARERYGDWINLLRHEVHHDQGNPDAHLRYIRVLYDNARLLSTVGAGGHSALWRQIDDAANDMLRHIPEENEKYVTGRLYRGIARVEMRAVMTDDDLDEAMKDIHAYVKANPESDRGNAALIHGERLVARHRGVRLSARRAEDREQKLQEYIERALAAAPSGPEVQLAYVRYLRQQLPDRMSERTEGVHADELNRAIHDLVAAARQSNDPIIILETAIILGRVASPDRLELATSLLAEQVQSDPNALAHKYFLAHYQMRTGELDAAHETARRIIDADNVGIQFIAQMQMALRIMAVSLVADIEFQRWAQATSDEDRDRAIDNLGEARAELESFSTDPANDPQLMRVEAKYKLARGEFRAAASRLERLIRNGETSPEVYLYSSFALERIGEIGLAYERLLELDDRLLANATPELLQQKAHLEVRLGRLAAAQETVEQMQRMYPESEQAHALLLAIQQAASGEEGDVVDLVEGAIRSAEQALVEGDIETARGAIFALMEGDEADNVRLNIAAAQIEIRSGALEQARPFVERGLEIQPDNLQLRQLQARIKTGDAIEAVRYFVDAQYEEPEERDIHLMLTYNAMVEQQRRAAAQLEERNMSADAAEAAELADRAEQQAKELLERIRAGHGDDPRVIEYEFNHALRDRDWSRASSVFERAANADIDVADLSMYRGRLALERGELFDAVQAFERAVELAPFSGTAWLGLAMSYQQVGNIREAMQAYEETYRINPNNLHGLRLYLGLLVQIGEETRALRILREAHSRIVRIPEFRDVWLQLEAEHGELAVAIRERQRVYQRNPMDRRNAIQFALLLAQSEPRPEAILDEDGQLRYSSRRWSAMSMRDRQRILQQVTQEWHNKAHEIADAIIDADGKDREAIVLKATLHRIGGDYEAGEQLLRELIETDDASDQLVRGHLQLAQYQLEAGRLSVAATTASRAMEYQRSDQRDAERFIANLLMSHNMYQQAIPYLEHILEANDDLQVRMQLIECHLNTGLVDKAEQELDRLEEDVEPDFRMLILRAAVHRVQMDRHLAAGEDQEAEPYREVIDQALNLAESMMPNNPMPHIQRAHVLLSVYQHTQRQRLLNEAMSALSEADAVRPGEPQTRTMRIDVLRAMGNERGAIREAEHLIEQMPQNVQYRQLLIRLHREMGQMERALEATNVAASTFPHSPTWPRLRGDLHRQLGKLQSAAQDYLAAYEISGEMSVLRQCVQTLLEMDPVPYQQIRGLLHEHSDAMDRDPVLAGYFAHALYETGRKSQAERHLRESYAHYRSLIEAGEQHPSDINVWFQAFDPIFSAQTPQEAEATMMALSDNAPDPYVQYWISRYWRQAGPEGRSRAVELLNRLGEDAAELGDDRLRVAVLFDLATVHYQMENYRPAAEVYHEVLELVPGNPLVMNNLAFILAEYLDSIEEGWHHARQALELAPEHPSILDTAGWIQFKRGNYQQAETLLRQSIELGETATSQIHMARLLAAQGRHEEALQRLQRANELQPDAETQEEIERLVDDMRTSAGVRE